MGAILIFSTFFQFLMKSNLLVSRKLTFSKKNNTKFSSSWVSNPGHAGHCEKDYISNLLSKAWLGTLAKRFCEKIPQPEYYRPWKGERENISGF